MAALAFREWVLTVANAVRDADITYQERQREVWRAVAAADNSFTVGVPAGQIALAQGIDIERYLRLERVTLTFELVPAPWWRQLWNWLCRHKGPLFLINGGTSTTGFKVELVVTRSDVQPREPPPPLPPETQILAPIG